MDARTQSAIDRGWALVTSVLASLQSLPGLVGGWLESEDWHAAFSQLRRAEAAARRILIILSADITVHPLVPRATTHNRARAARKRMPRGFPLFDTLPEFPTLPALPDPGVHAPMSVTAQAQTPARDTAGLLARLNGLADVMDNPIPAARRMARFLNRGPRRNTRLTPLRPGLPPGFRPRDGLRPDMDTLMETHLGAIHVLNRPLLC